VSVRKTSQQILNHWRKWVVFPIVFANTNQGSSFIIYDSFEDDEADDDNRVICFGTRKNIELLAKSHTWFVDGTFKTAPNIFSQVAY